MDCGFRLSRLYLGIYIQIFTKQQLMKKKNKLEREKGGMWMVLWGVNGMEEMM